MYDPVSNKPDFASSEHDALRFWDDEQIFAKSLEQTRDGEAFVFYDGPPFATGLPHYGHLLAGTIKDIVPRYQTMRGRYVERRFGWDCHGLPIEALAQEALGLAGAPAIVERGVDVFNEQCRSMVQRYVKEWRQTVTRMGRWVDFDNDYKTMDRSYMESIWWVFKQLWDQERIYKSYRIMPYSWALSTPLSNFEAGNNYKDVQDPAVTVRCRVTHGAPAQWGETHCLIWTTTPWTLPGNLAICAGPTLEYVAVRDREQGCVYVLAQARLESVYSDADAYEVVWTGKGTDLLGWQYAPLFPYFEDQPKAFRVLNDDFVSTEDGTGLVHMAPAYGEDDFRVCRAAGIDLVDPLSETCNFTDAVPEYAGQFCKDADKAIIRRLKDEGKLVHQTTLVHSYPFCERTETPLVYRAIEAWYVRVEDKRERLVELNEQIRWVPDYVGSKRFGNWLRDAKDWNISRNRFWGSCLPVWVAEDGSDSICVGSVEELEQLAGQPVTDLHKHVLDEIVFERNGKRYHRTPEVLDCWFESGSMPLAQQHYPFERADEMDAFFPADFIAEGLDQTRGWFYTLLVLSTLLFDRACFKNVIVNGLVLAEDGKKMSKRLKNYPDPMTLIDVYGADAVRLYMIYSPVVRAENLRFAESGVKHVLRHLMIPWWNAYSFFVTYANIDGWSEDGVNHPNSPNVLDRWIVSSLETLVEEVTQAMDRYDLQRSVRPFVAFIEDLTNWYIRRSRRRFWKSQDDDDKQYAYRTLRYVLIQLSKVSAPFVPFISETIYRNLRSEDMPESVHLCRFPEAASAARDHELETQMSLIQTVVRLGRQLRTDHSLKVRQPLAVLHVVSRDESLRKQVRGLEDLVLDELNVKQVRDDADESALAKLNGKANFRKLGPRFGKQMGAVSKVIMALDGAELERLASGESIEVAVADETVLLAPDDVLLERTPREGMVVASEGDVIVALETKLDEALICEGLAREFVSKIQNLRKSNGYNVSQRIAVRYAAPEAVQQAVAAFAAYVQAEVLALSCEAVAQLDGETTDLNGHCCTLVLSPVTQP